MNTCGTIDCEAPAQDKYLCQYHVESLQEWIDKIPNVLPELDDSIARTDNVRPGNPARRKRHQKRRQLSTPQHRRDATENQPRINHRERRALRQRPACSRHRRDNPRLVHQSRTDRLRTTRRQARAMGHRAAPRKARRPLPGTTAATRMRHLAEAKRWNQNQRRENQRLAPARQDPKAPRVNTQETPLRTERSTHRPPNTATRMKVAPIKTLMQ